MLIIVIIETIAIVVLIVYLLVHRAKTTSEYERNRKELYKAQISNKNLQYLLLLDDAEKKILTFFNRQGWSRVAVYGVNGIGHIVIQRLLCSGVNICYGIDRNPNAKSDDIKIVQVEQIQPNIDVIIVTPEQEFVNIEQKISEYSSAEIVRLSSLIEEVLLQSENCE